VTGTDRSVTIREVVVTIRRHIAVTCTKNSEMSRSVTVPDDVRDISSEMVRTHLDAHCRPLEQSPTLDPAQDDALRRTEPCATGGESRARRRGAHDDVITIFRAEAAQHAIVTDLPI
jgi:hypothetical protein